MEDKLSSSIRQSILFWLNFEAQKDDFIMDWKKLTGGFHWNGQPVPLIGAKGIWKPKLIKELPISITSTVNSTYKDELLENDQIIYRYRGKDPHHPDNIGLRNCLKYNTPLVYFHQITKGRYFVASPVFVIDDDPTNLTFKLSAGSETIIKQTENLASEPEAIYERKYKTRQVIQRLHQKGFRERVLKAYSDNCAICKLKHRGLLDAAHIIPDGDKESLPIVSNGISLCKIHHAAYDQNIIGISPDYIVNIRQDILAEVDGPMLKHGLQEMRNRKLILPRKETDRPNKEGLDIRYQQFLQA